MEGSEHESGSLQEAMRNLGERQELLSETLERMMEHLQHHLAHEIAEIVHAKGKQRRSNNQVVQDEGVKRASLVKRSDSGSLCGDLSKPADTVFPLSPRSTPRRQISRQTSPQQQRRQISGQPRHQISTQEPAQHESADLNLDVTAADPTSSCNPSASPTSVKSMMSSESPRFISTPSLHSQRSSISVSARVSLLKLAPKNEISQRCQELALNPYFQGGCAVMILVNSMLLGYSAEYAVDHDDEEPWCKGANQFCALFFFFESVIRIIAFGKTFFIGDEWRWNIFDFILVVQSIMDFLLETFTPEEGFAGMLSALKTLKLLRVARVIRVFKFFRQLSQMVLMVVHSLKSLTWVLVLLFLMMYTFAIFFTQICTDNIKENPDAAHVGKTKEQFGSVVRTIYSLLLSILGGMNWGELCDSLILIGIMPTALFLFYILFSTLAMLNIITGVFVENAVEVAKNRKDILLEQANQKREGIITELQSLFTEIDEDETGYISYPELKGAWFSENVRACFTTLGLDLNDMERLYFLLDEEGTGEIQIDDFLAGCLKLRGEARSIDVHAVLRETKKLDRRLEDQEMRLERAISIWGTLGFADVLKKHTSYIIEHILVTSTQKEGTVQPAVYKSDDLVGGLGQGIVLSSARPEQPCGFLSM